jgi:hypothetical protein
MRPTWIVRLYPRKWRERYETEMRALLEQHDSTFFTMLDLFLGALDARIDPQYRTERMLAPMNQLNRLRSAAMTVFIAFPCFLIPAGWLYIQIVDPDPGVFNDHYQTLLRISPVLNATTIVIRMSLIVALLAILAGMLLIIGALLRRISSQRRWLLLAGSFVVGVGALIALRGPSLLVVLGMFALLATLVIAFARSQSNAQFLRLLLVPTGVAGLAMVGMWIATTVAWGVLFQDSQTRNASWFRPMDMFFMVVSIVWLAIPAGLALSALVRGFRALTTREMAEQGG